LSGTARLALSLFLPFAGLFVLNHGLTLFLAERGAPGDAGRWTISLQLLSLLPLLAGPMGTVLLPHFSRGAAGGEESLRADAGPILARLGAILCAAAVALLIAAGPLAAFLFGDAAAAAVGTVRILIAFYLIEALKFALDPLLIALNLWGTLARLEAARLALALPAGYWAVGKWSLTGAAAVLASAIAVSAAGKWALYRTAAKPIRERESHALG
jgi:O-antigen/teichoic acid export membrane protein